MGGVYAAVGGKEGLHLFRRIEKVSLVKLSKRFVFGVALDLAAGFLLSSPNLPDLVGSSAVRLVADFFAVFLSLPEGFLSGEMGLSSFFDR